MSIASAFFAGVIATVLIIVGIKLIGQRHAALGWGVIIAVALFTLFGGYVSFSI